LDLAGEHGVQAEFALRLEEDAFAGAAINAREELQRMSEGMAICKK
jgi:hypothetical protein